MAHVGVWLHVRQAAVELRTRDTATRAARQHGGRWGVLWRGQRRQAWQEYGQLACALPPSRRAPRDRERNIERNMHCRTRAMSLLFRRPVKVVGGQLDDVMAASGPRGCSWQALGGE